MFLKMLSFGRDRNTQRRYHRESTQATKQVALNHNFYQKGEGHNYNSPTHDPSVKQGRSRRRKEAET